MSGKSEKYIRRAVKQMLESVAFKPGQEELARRVFVRKTKQVHHQNPGLVKSYLVDGQPDHRLNYKVQTAVLAGQEAIQKGLRNRRAKAQAFAHNQKG